MNITGVRIARSPVRARDPVCVLGFRVQRCALPRNDGDRGLALRSGPLATVLGFELSSCAGRGVRASGMPLLCLFHAPQPRDMLRRLPVGRSEGQVKLT